MARETRQKYCHCGCCKPGLCNFTFKLFSKRQEDDAIPQQNFNTFGSFFFVCNKGAISLMRFTGEFSTFWRFTGKVTERRIMLLTLATWLTYWSYPREVVHMSRILTSLPCFRLVKRLVGSAVWYWHQHLLVHGQRTADTTK